VRLVVSRFRGFGYTRHVIFIGAEALTVERFVFLPKIDAGLAELNAGRGIPHDEITRRLGL